MQSDGPICLSAAWQAMVSHLTEHIKKYLGGEDKAAMHWARLLVDKMGQE